MDPKFSYLNHLDSLKDLISKTFPGATVTLVQENDDFKAYSLVFVSSNGNKVSYSIYHDGQMSGISTPDGLDMVIDKWFESLEKSTK